MRSANERAHICVEVTDSGVGIDTSVLPKIFDPFEQGSYAVARQFGGLGLGLAIATATVDAHGGRITVESAGPGQGATFTVELATLGEGQQPGPPPGYPSRSGGTSQTALTASLAGRATFAASVYERAPLSADSTRRK